jgi:hypothetical protein
VSTLLHATVYVFLHNLLNVLVQIANEMELQNNYIAAGNFNSIKAEYWAVLIEMLHTCA